MKFSEVYIGGGIRVLGCDVICWTKMPLDNI